VRLESWYVPAGGGAGSMRLRLVNDGDVAVGDFELTFTTVVQLDPAPPARLVGRRSGCHVVAPPPGTCLSPGEGWELTATCGHRPAHANDGPASAFLTHADGTLVDVVTGIARRVVVGPPAPLTFRAAPNSDIAGEAVAAVAARDERLHPYRPAVFTSTGEREVAATIDESLRVDSFAIEEAGDGWAVTAGSPVALQQAMTALVRAARGGDGGGPVPVGRWAAMHEWRGLHVDLARRFFPAADVEWLVDVAAWHGLNRLHVHLTDDEAWRIPVPGHPALTEVGGWRGAGRPIPALLGSAADAYGGAYSWDDVARWHARAAETGLVLIPEIDVPGHCFAALAAQPSLVDPDDTSGARSVQHFADNVLNPGVAGTWPLLEEAFGALAEHFPSPWLHLGGDEVAAGAWSGSPLARAWGAARGAGTFQQLGAAFLREVIALVRRTTGRRVGVWQEASESGAMEPDDGYVVGWKSSEASRRLAAAGYDVVSSPAEAYYLDMAASPDWYEPGTSWAGHTSSADIAAFDPTAGWSAAERTRLLGVQACLWTEHVPDRPTMERLLFPRLTAIATAAWPGPSPT
jgi:hexosaminidase